MSATPVTARQVPLVGAEAALTLPLGPTYEQDPAPAGDATTKTWRMSRLQVVNWGGFSGHHVLDLDEEATLLTGASGTGKSTLLDAIIGVLMDSGVPFNGASNDAGMGRARSATQRNVLSYVRGKVGDTVAGATDRTVAVLRGESGPTWSAIGLTFTASTGEHYTALRAYYASGSASADADLTREYYTAPFAFDLTLLQPFVAGKFNKREVKNAFPQMVAHGDSYTAFCAAFSVALGIGDGRDRKALGLLARVQRGGSMSSVAHLFREFVLPTPPTFERADTALRNFADMAEAHATMDTAKRKLRALTGIADTHDELLRHAEIVERADSFRVSVPDSPFTLWHQTRRVALLDAREAELSAESAAARNTFKTADADAQSLRASRQAAESEHREAGGGYLTELDARIAGLRSALESTTRARQDCDQLAAELGVSVRSATDLDALRSDPSTSDAALREAGKVLQDRLVDLGIAARDRRAEREEIRRDLEHYSRRRDLLPRVLVTQRAELAGLLGLADQDLPFVAELIDMHPDYEAWRPAVELALGGYATQMLVPEQYAQAVRRAINGLRWDRRINFDTVDLSRRPRHDPDATTLPGRLVLRETQFEGPLLAALIDRFNYVCVADASELDNVTTGLTITGQIRSGSRGAHGGNTRHTPVIGFSNEGLLAALRARDDALVAEIETIDGQRDDAQTRLGALQTRAVKLSRLLALSWPDIDVDAAASRLHDAEDEKKRLLAASDVLAELETRIAGLRAQEDTAIGARERAKADLDAAGKEWAQVVDDKDAAAAAAESLAARIGELTDAQAADLDARLAAVAIAGVDLTPRTLRAHVDKVRDGLIEQRASSVRSRDNYAKALRDKFETFNETWPDNNRGTDPYLDFADFADVVAGLEGGGLGDLADKFRAVVAKWSGEDLLLLHQSFTSSHEEIRARLDPINEVLASLEFGRDKRRLSLEMTETPSTDVREFRRELRDLASGTTTIADAAEAEARFERISLLMASISKDRRAEREALLDVRRHVHVQAIQHNPDPIPDQKFDTLGEQSGGESQELIAFILGAALRYQLGDRAGSGPRYRTVVLDEAFIKADPEYMGRGISAWRRLGFQLLIAAPVEKYAAIEPLVPSGWITNKDDTKRSVVSPIARISGEDGP